MRRRRVRLNPTSTYCQKYARHGPTKKTGRRKATQQANYYRSKAAAYRKRNDFAAALSSLGFASYDAYLESELWARIRQRAFTRWGRSCRGCGGPAIQLHHSNYSLAVLDGTRLDGLWPVCRDCHKDIHQGTTSIKEANGRLIERWRATQSKRRSG